MADLKIWYDREGDYLEVRFEDIPATMEEIDEDVFERRTPERRIIGFTIFNFSKHDQSKLSLPLAVIATPSQS